MIKLSQTFTFLDYQISHSEILLRSEQGITNCDVIISGVTYMELSMCFRNLRLRHSNQEEINYLEEKTKPLKSMMCYTLEHDEGKAYVVGGFLKVYKTNFGFGISALPSLERNNWELLAEL